MNWKLHVIVTFCYINKQEFAAGGIGLLTSSCTEDQLHSSACKFFTSAYCNAVRCLSKSFKYIPFILYSFILHLFKSRAIQYSAYNVCNIVKKNKEIYSEINLTVSFTVTSNKGLRWSLNLNSKVILKCVSKL